MTSGCHRGKTSLRPGAGIDAEGLAEVGSGPALNGAHSGVGLGAAFCPPHRDNLFASRPGVEIFLPIFDEPAYVMELGAFSFTSPQPQRRRGVSQVSCREACIHSVFSLGQRLNVIELLTATGMLQRTPPVKGGSLPRRQCAMQTSGCQCGGMIARPGLKH